MKPIEFEEQNILFGENQPEYQPLPAFKGKGPQGEVISCWELTDEEIEKLKVTKQIWVSLLTFDKPLHPIFITVHKTDLINP